MAKIKGKSILLMVEIESTWTAVGATRDHSLNITQSLEDSTTKDSDEWEEQVSITRGMTIDLNGLHDPTETVGPDEFKDYLIAGTGFKIRYGVTGTAGSYLLEVDVDITSYSEAAPYQGLATWDLSLKANGKPTKVIAGS
jgi:predicted secreted protein